MGYFSLPVRDGQEYGHDQGGNQLQIVGVQAQLQNYLQHEVVDHGTQGYGKHLQTEVLEDLAEGHFTDDNGGQTDNNGAAPHAHIGRALELSQQQTRGWQRELLKLDLSYLGWALLSLLPALYVDGQRYMQALGDPASILSVGSTLPEILVCGLWSLAVSLFFLPNYQCVSLDYFDAAKAAVPGGRTFRDGGPDDLGSF